MRDYTDHNIVGRERSDHDRREGSRHERQRPSRAFFNSDENFERYSRNDDRFGPSYSRTRGWGGLMDRPDEGRRERSSRRNDLGSRDFDRERDPRFGPDAYRNGLPRNETERLIASDKVEGTPVIGPNGERLGSIHNFMVDKRSGEVVYAVLKSGGGFLGLDERYYPVNWDELTYDTRADGYGVEFTRDELEDRRSFDRHGREHQGKRRERDDRREDNSWW